MPNHYQTLKKSVERLYELQYGVTITWYAEPNERRTQYGIFHKLTVSPTMVTTAKISTHQPIPQHAKLRVSGYDNLWEIEETNNYHGFLWNTYTIRSQTNQPTN